MASKRARTGADRDRGADEGEARPQTGSGLGAMVAEFKRRAREEIDAGEQRRGPAVRPRDRRQRPQPLWGSFPLSELAIAAGVAIAAIGFIGGGGAPLLAGIGVCVVAVGEIIVREHVTGYRSHAILLGLLAVALFQALMYAATGGNWVGATALVSGLIVFAAVTVASRRWFDGATRRQAAS